MSDKALQVAAIAWCVVAVFGQFLFVWYMVFVYGNAAAKGDWLVMNKVMPHGYVPGDTFGNSAVAVHILMAIVITAGGALQLVPQLRRRAPTFHRWNGRVFMASAFVASVAGLYMVWVRGAVGGFVQHLGISLDAVLIMVCAAMSLRHALAREIAVHRRWALRTWLVANGQWFFRIGLMFWILVNHGPVGFDPKTFQGPALSVLAFADSLLPLAVLEIYLRVQRKGPSSRRIALAGALVLLTAATGIGIAGALMGLWLPNL